MEFFCFHRDRSDSAALRDALVAFGPLLSDDGGTWLGTAALVQATDPVSARAVLGAQPYSDTEVHPWCVGGRPS